MSSAGTSGTSNTNWGNAANGPTGAGGAPDDTVEVIEVIEVDEPTMTADEALAAEQEALERALGEGGFPWWYVPAIGLPVVVGAGAAIWYLTKGPQSFQDAYDLVTRQNTRKAQAQKAMRRGMRTARASAKNVSESTEDLRERLADVWDDARDSVLDWWDTMTDRDTLEQLRGRANDAAGSARDQFAKVAAGVATAGAVAAARQKAADLASSARGTARSTTSNIQGSNFDLGNWLSGIGATGSSWFTKSQAQELKDKAQAQMRQAKVKGTLAKAGAKGAVPAVKVGAPVAAKAVVTKAKAEKAVKKTGRRANRFWGQTRAFTFGALVTATLTYIRIWRSRLDERNLRETAGGRMVRDA